MRLHRGVAIAVLSALILGSGIGRAEDAANAPPPAGFLEFLGSVDRLSDLNPNYLSRPAPVKVARPAANAPPSPPPPPPPPSPPPEKTNG
ncbi:MAG TPA: hypothetical protein VET46_01080 [Steroidobacteraceae bacterium]|nr:hypothetical protein [Steroidobacteraceae bacterium]